MKFIFYLTLVLFVFWGVGQCAGDKVPTATSTASTASSPGPSLDRSPEMQARRQALIAKLQTGGIIGRITIPSTIPHVQVKAGFFGLDYDDKEAFVSAVYAYYYAQDDRRDMLVLNDALTNKRVGYYSQARGLQLD